MGRRTLKGAGPNTPKRQTMEKQLQRDVIMREAAAIVLAEIRKMKDAQTKDKHHKFVSADELPKLVNMQAIAHGFQDRLAMLSSNEDALGQRLHKWRIRGVEDDPVVPRGRPRTVVPSPLTTRTVAIVANRALKVSFWGILWRVKIKQKNVFVLGVLAGDQGPREVIEWH